MTDDDTLVEFLDEDARGGGAEQAGSQPVWKILVVDDDQDVHDTTDIALRGVHILDRPLQLLHASSAAEALAALGAHSDVAVILLDVVMETPDAGLRTIGHIREQLGLRNVRIILRTGQPGYAPELEAITRYDINDYKTKTELTQTRLFTCLTTAVRSYHQLCSMDAGRRGLEQVILASNQLMAKQGLRAFAEGVIMQIAGFVGIDPEGVVCAQESPATQGDAFDAYTVVAAAGRYRELIDRSFASLDDSEAVRALRRCLRDRATVVDAHSLTLYFPGRDGQNFAAYVESRQTMRDVDRHLLKVFCSNIALCGANVELVSRLSFLAFTDPLVGLPNRRAFLDGVGMHVNRRDRAPSVMALLDIDQFAEINDMLGHAFGDHLLLGVANRLGEALGSDCLVARVAGDGFAVHGPPGSLQPERLRALLDEPLDVDGVQHPLSVSVGLVALDVDEPPDPNVVLKNAYIALKQARTHGQRQVAWYSEEAADSSRNRTRMLSALRRAVAEEELFVVYQPIVRLADRQPVAVEALLRWRDDAGTYVSPDRFIPVAEHSGLIVDMGQAVLRAALHDARRLAGAGFTGLRMSVNVSATQFRQADFVRSVRDALAEADAGPEMLELEVTESVAMTGMEGVLQGMRRLRELGVGLAIDDFGTGYSSLSYLHRIPADRLKIDRAFVWGLGSAESERIAAMLPPLGRQLGMRVVAEGVETEAQASWLRELDCDEGQGYLFARPMTMQVLLDWLAERQRPVDRT